MTVYVDELREYRREDIQPAARRWGIWWCHLLSDSGDTAELHDMALQLGLKVTYYQNHIRPRLRHYDLLPRKREEAVRLGAVEVSALEWARETLRLSQEAAP